MRIIKIAWAALLLPIFAFASNNAVVCNQGTTYDMNQCLIKAVKQADLDLVKKYKMPTQKVTAFKKLRQSLCLLHAKEITGTYSGVYYGHCELSLTQWFVQQQGP